MEEDSTSLGLEASIEETWNIEDFTNDQYVTEINDDCARTEFYDVGLTKAGLLGQLQPRGKSSGTRGVADYEYSLCALLMRCKFCFSRSIH